MAGSLKAWRTNPHVAPTRPKDYPWHRQTSLDYGSIDKSPIIIQAAEEVNDDPAFDWISIVFQPLGALAAIAAVFVILYLTGSGLSMGLYMLIGGITGVLGILWGVLRYRKQRKKARQKKDNGEQRYCEYISGIEDTIIASIKNQIAVLNKRFPAAFQCASFNSSSPQLWCRQSRDEDFMVLRLGEGRTRFSREIKVPDAKYNKVNPLDEKARAIAEKYQWIDGSPVCCNLIDYPVLGVVGPHDASLEQIKSLVVQATMLHSYEDLKLVTLYPEIERNTWEELRFIPHVWNDEHTVRYMAGSTADIHDLLDGDLSQILQGRLNDDSTSYGRKVNRPSPQLLFVVTDLSSFFSSSFSSFLDQLTSGLGASFIFYGSRRFDLPPQCQRIADIQIGGFSNYYASQNADNKEPYSPDTLQFRNWNDYARSLAPIRLESSKHGSDIPQKYGFLEMWGVGKPEQLPIEKNWKTQHPEKSMRVPLGVSKGGKRFEFDINPNYSGAHGLFNGTNGSGKTSVVRTWILSMASTFPPEQVSFVLIDFKEPGLMTDLINLPHIAGTIGQLDEDVERNLIALRAEMNRRSRLFKNAGVQGINSYLRLHNENSPLAEEPMAFLFIVLDELSEFKHYANERNVGSEWGSLLDKLYSTGRSLGIHIISGSQTPAPFSEKMLGNANFRWCLKTTDRSDSMTLLRTGAAYELTVKGRTLSLDANHNILTEFQPAFSDARYMTEDEVNQTPEYEMSLVKRNGQILTAKKADNKRKDSVLKVVVDYINREASENGYDKARPIWPQRLPVNLSADSLPEPQQEVMKSIVGLVDQPAAQAQCPLEINIKEEGSFLIFGGPRSGKTTFLQSYAWSLLNNTSSEKLEVFIIEEKAGDFTGFRAFPQVRIVVHSSNAANVVSHVNNELLRRAQNILNPSEKNIVLLIDGIDQILVSNRAELMNIAQTGSGSRVYMLASSMNQYSQLLDYIKGYSFWFSARPSDYYTILKNREVAAPPLQMKGRGIMDRNQQVMSFQVAKIDAEASGEALQMLISKQAQDKWGAVSSTGGIVSKQNTEEGTVLLGENISTLNTVRQDFYAASSLLIISRLYSKRAEMLQSVAGQLLEGDYKEAVFVDMDASIRELFPRAKHISSGPELDKYLGDIRDDLIARKNNLREGKKEAPYIFVVNDIGKCLKNSAEISAVRIDRNCIFAASSYNIFFVAASSVDGFNRAYVEEEHKSPNASGREIIPVHRLFSGRCLMLGLQKGDLPQEKNADAGFDEEKDFYLSIGKFEPIRTVNVPMKEVQ